MTHNQQVDREVDVEKIDEWARRAPVSLAQAVKLTVETPAEARADD